MKRQMLAQPRARGFQEGTLPRKHLHRHGASSPSRMPPILHEVLHSPGRPLDEGSRIFMESSFGRDFSRVRIHTGPRAAEPVEAVNARAYTVGSDVVFGRGQLAPGTSESRSLLAHELTHVVQQVENHGSPSFASATEAEARSNSKRALAGLPARVESSAPAGAVQCEDKVSGGLSTERKAESKTGGVTNKFSYEAFVKLPVFRNGKIGNLSFLEDLKLTNKGTKDSSELIPLSFSDLSAIQASVALKLISFELPPLKLPKSIGELSLEGNLTQAGSLKQTFGDKGAFTQDVSTTANVEGGFKSSSLLPERLGTLTLGTTLGATGILKQTFGGDKPGFAPSASAELGVNTKFLSPLSASPALSLGGLLGDRAQLSVEGKSGLEAGISAEEGGSFKPSGSLEVGLLGKRPGKKSDNGKKSTGIESYLKVKVAGEGEVDLQKGGIKSSAFSIGIIGGVSF